MSSVARDVVVVGAGPAGTAAACTLARAGIDVTLLDKSRFPRDKTCGDALTTMALRSLAGLGLDPSDVGSWRPVPGATVHPPEGSPTYLGLPSDGTLFAAISRRRDLDNALLALAHDAGATMRCGVAVTRVSPSNHIVELELADGSQLRARHVVIASGAAGHRRTAGDMHATRVYLETGEEAPLPVHVLFLAGVIPGYAWVFPVDATTVNVGIAVQRRRHTARDAVAATREFLHSAALQSIAGPTRQTDRIRSAPIPTTLALHRSLRRTLFVGDAAGLADPMTGEGIGQALRSGVAAAAAIAENPETDASGRYRRDMIRAYGGDHIASRLGLRALGDRRSASAAVRLMGSNSQRRSYYARWMWEEIDRAAVLSPLRRGDRVPPPTGVTFDTD